MLLFLEQVVVHALASLPESRHARFSNALISSLSDPSATSATISDSYGFNPHQQYKLKLTLLKPLAWELLNDQLQMSRAVFEKRFGWQHYLEVFGHEPDYVNSKLKVMAITYKKWACMVGQPEQLFPVPERARALAAYVISAK